MNKTLKLIGVLLVSLGLAGGSGAQEIFNESGNLYSTRELEKSVDAAPQIPISILSASTLQGTLEISASDDTRIKIIYSKKARADSRSEAIDYIDQIAVHLTRNAGGAKIELRAPNPAPWTDNETGLVSARIYIPEFCRVDIDAAYFDINAKGPFETFEVPSSLGRLEVEHVTGLLDLSTSNRRVSVENISGRISVTTSNATLIARNIKSTDGQAVFRNEGGEIKILGVSGDINVKNSYGKTQVDMFDATGKKSSIRSNYGPIEIYLTALGKSQLIVSNRYEDIELQLPSNLSVELELAVEEEGKIEVSNIAFKPDFVQRDRLSLIAGEGEALINGSVRGKGNVYIRAYDPEE